MVRFSMMRSAVLFAALVFSWPAMAQNCNGQFAAGQMCGNNTGSQGSMRGGSLSSFLDQNFGTTQGTMLDRGASVWSATVNPILGAGGTIGTLTLTPGTAPGSPANGQMWVTSTGMFVRVNGSTVGPLLWSGNAVTTFSAGTTGFTPNSATSGVVTLAGTLNVANGGTGITSFGTGVATALGINVGSAGAFLVNGGALGTPSSGTLTNATGLPASTGISGLGTGVATALGQNVTGSGGIVLASAPSIASLTVTTAFTATGLVTLGDLATQATNTALVNATAGTASPTAQSMPSCSTANRALQWTTNTGFGCATITAAATSIAEGTTTVTNGNAGGLLLSNGTGAVLTNTVASSVAVTITGTLVANALNSTPVGSTTASTGAFTTLSATGILNINLSGSTAPTVGNFYGPGAQITGFGGSSGGTSLAINGFVGNEASSIGVGSLYLSTAEGTPSSPTAIQSGDPIGAIRAVGYNGSNYLNAEGGANQIVGSAEIRFQATQNWTASGATPTNIPAQIMFYTTANGSAVPILAATIGQDQSLNVVGGYSANGTAGVTCSAGVPSSSFTAKNGIVTHC